jgi:hypothetical protein
MAQTLPDFPGNHAIAGDMAEAMARSRCAGCQPHHLYDGFITMTPHNKRDRGRRIADFGQAPKNSTEYKVSGMLSLINTWVLSSIDES